MKHHYENKIQLQYILEMCPNMMPFHLQSHGIIAYIKDTYQEQNELKLYAVAGTVDNQLIVVIRQNIPGLNKLDVAINK